MDVFNSDIVVVGAGPAGSAASIYLSQSKIPHLLVDKAEFPRDKVCGDAVSCRSFEKLRKLFPERVDAFLADKHLATPTAGIRFVAPSGNKVDVPFPPTRSGIVPGVVATREDFDSFVYSLTSSHYCTRLSSTQVKIAEDEKLTLQLKTKASETQLQPKLVIAADGAHSPFYKKLNGHHEGSHHSAGVRTYWQGVTGISPDNNLELIFLKELLPGYLWIFGLPDDKANVGLGILSKDVSKKKLNIKKLLLQLIEEHPLLSSRFEHATLLSKPQGFGLPLGSKKRNLVSDQLVLTGDAASLIDPFTGEGIGNAITSGMLAAQQANKCWESGNFSKAALLPYQDKVYELFWRELKLSRSLQKLTRFPLLFNLIVSKVNGNAELQEVLTSMYTDVEARNKLKSLLFYLRVLSN